MADFHFYHPIEVRYGDLDPQGHVNNAKFLTYFEQARIHYFVQLGLFGKDRSFMEVGFILADVHVVFLSPILLGMDVRAGLRTSKLGNKSMDVEHILVDEVSKKELARGETVLVTFDYRTGRSIPIPDEWRKKIREFEGL